MKDYHHFVKPAILTSLLGYLFSVFGLLFDLGRYYRLPYPMVVSFGFSSIMFLIAWHFALYIMILLTEWSPSLFEWLNLKKLREFFHKLAVWATVFGVVIAGGHQSALGALFLIAPGKLHPLWYSELLPLYFLLSAIIAGLTSTPWSGLAVLPARAHPTRVKARIIQPRRTPVWRGSMPPREQSRPFPCSAVSWRWLHKCAAQA
jgi:Ni/Fe-hydrogenase subunit HybB-like protein